MGENVNQALAQGLSDKSLLLSSSTGYKNKIEPAIIQIAKNV